MSTTYILHGGKSKVDNESNREYYKEFTGNTPKDTIKILACYWARNKEEWDPLLKIEKELIIKEADKEVIIDIAIDPKNLVERISDYDVLYVSSGDNILAKESLKELNGLKEQLDGKVYIGSSMGAFLACNNYVLSLDHQDYTASHSGLGLLPLNLLCHFNIEKRKEMKLELLRDKDNPILTLDEYQFVKIYY